MKLKTKNGYFYNESNELVFFRGVSLYGEESVFRNNQSVSAIERPVLSDARAHFQRIKSWGFNLVRIPVSWEVIEPVQGSYSQNYLKYISSLIKHAEKEDLSVQIVFIQENWGRYAGIGAPTWTMEKIGIDLASAAEYAREDNIYSQYISHTMSTIFFAGNTYLPNLRIDGKPAETLLQNHFIHAVKFLLSGLKDQSNVIGMDLFGNVNPGFINAPRLDEYKGGGLGLINTPTPFQLMYLSEGNRALVNKSLVYGGHGITVWKSETGNKQTSLWQKDKSCPFHNEGVWGYDPNGAPILYKPDYFPRFKKVKDHFEQGYYYPFLQKVQHAVKTPLFYFYEKEPTSKGIPGMIPSFRLSDSLIEFTGRYIASLFLHPVWKIMIPGRERIKIALFQFFRKIKKRHKLPVFISEAGFRLNFRNYKTATSLYNAQADAFDRMIGPMEKNFLSFSLKHYIPEPDRGNYSLFMPSLQGVIDADGGRGTRGFSRAWVKRMKGMPVSTSFDYQKSLFKLAFRSDEETGYCEIFLPPVHFGDGFSVITNAGTYVFHKRTNILFFQGEKGVSLYGITIVAEKK